MMDDDGENGGEGRGVLGGMGWGRGLWRWGLEGVVEGVRMGCSGTATASVSGWVGA